MGTLDECTKVFENLLYKEYILTLENGQNIVTHFEKGNFYHLLGLHKLTDIRIVSNEQNAPNVIYKNIKAGKIAQKDICKSQFFYKIENRIGYFPLIPCLLHSKIIIDFDKSILPHKTELQNTKYILYKKIDSGYVHLTLGEKGKGIYPETFFYEQSNRYISEQKLLDVISVQVIDKKR